MKKSSFLLPLVAAFALVGCTSNNASEADTGAVVENAVGSTNMNNGGWQSGDITPTAMPSSMNQPVSTPTYGASAPVATTRAPSTAPVAAPTTYGANTETVGNCQVIRNADGTPVYAQMTKGCYTDSTYTVGAQDTLYLISFLSGSSASQIAQLNGISTSTKLKVGQSLRVR